jgi:hypothetical protein
MRGDGLNGFELTTGLPEPISLYRTEEKSLRIASRSLRPELRQIDIHELRPGLVSQDDDLIQLWIRLLNVFMIQGQR